MKLGITDEELFENIRVLWMKLGRQPSYSEKRAPQSQYSAGTYENRFGSWSNLSSRWFHMSSLWGKSR